MNQTEKAIKAMSADELTELRPDLHIAEHLPAREAAEKLVETLKAAKIDGAAGKAIVALAQESQEPVRQLFTTFLSQLAALDVDDAARESAQGKAVALAKELGIEDAEGLVAAQESEDDGEGEGQPEGDGTKPKPEAAKPEGEDDPAEEPAQESDDDEPSETELLRGELDAKEELSRCIESMAKGTPDKFKARVREKLEPRIKAHEIRGAEAAKAAFEELVDDYNRAAESMGIRPEFDGIGDPYDGDDPDEGRATESKKPPKRSKVDQVVGTFGYGVPAGGDR